MQARNGRALKQQFESLTFYNSEISFIYLFRNKCTKKVAYYIQNPYRPAFDFSVFYLRFTLALLAMFPPEKKKKVSLCQIIVLRTFLLRPY